MPKSTGCSDVVLQRQPLPAFRNANAFAILKRCATDKLSRLPGAAFALPDFRSQQVPVQPDATGLQTANGDSTIISTSAVTSALSSATLLPIWDTRLTARKVSQALAAWICAPQSSTASASGNGEARWRPKIFPGSPLAAATSAVFSLK